MGKNTAVVETEDDDKMTFLLPGHIWRRTETNALATVIVVTNTYLPPKLKLKHPPQVVYADERNRITSVPVDRFLEGRVFENVNPDIEKRVDMLFTPIEAEQSVSSVDPIPETKELDRVESDVEISFESSSNQQVPELPAVMLEDAFQSYEQDPDLLNGFIRHKLQFSLDELTLAQLRDAFGNPGVVYGTFLIKSDKIETRVEWDEFHGAYPKVTHKGTSAVLVFLSPSQTVSVPPAEAVTAPVAEPQAVEQQIEATNVNTEAQAPSVTVSAT